MLLSVPVPHAQPPARLFPLLLVGFPVQEFVLPIPKGQELRAQPTPGGLAESLAASVAAQPTLAKRRSAEEIGSRGGGSQVQLLSPQPSVLIPLRN